MLPLLPIKKALLITLIGLSLLLTIGAGPAAAAYPPDDEAVQPAHIPGPTGYVSTYYLNVRSGPGTNYAQIGSLHHNQQVFLVGRNASTTWLQIETGQGQGGWVFAQYINAPASIKAGLPITDSGQPPIPPHVPELDAVVTSYWLNVRSGPGTNYATTGRLWRGEHVLLVGRNAHSNWLLVRLPNGSKGWVAAQYLHTLWPISELPVVDGGHHQPGPVGRVTSNRLNVRTGPGLDYDIVDRLSRGQQVRLLGRNAAGSWVKISIGQNQGWVSSSYMWSQTPLHQLPVL